MYELRAGRGQRWNISLLDFAIAHAPTPSAVTGTGNGNAANGDGPAWEPAGAVCRRYAVIHEELNAMQTASSSGYNDEMTVCGGTSDRQRTVFLSQTEIIRLEVRAHPAADIDDQTDLFLLQFAGQSMSACWRFTATLTPSTPAVPDCCCSKCSVPHWSNPP